MSQAVKSLPEVLRDRRSTPSFDGRPISAEDIRAILEAGISAPSGYNVQPWRFIVVQSPEQKRRLRGSCFNQAKVEEASVVIACCGDADSWRRDADEIVRMGLKGGMSEGYAAQLKSHVENYLHSLNEDQMHGWLNKQVTYAATYMQLMAECMGYDTASMEGFEEEKVREVLRLPLSYWTVSLLCVGHLKGPDKYFGGRFDVNHTCFAAVRGSMAWKKPRRWLLVLLSLLGVAVCLAGYIAWNPFWLIDHSVDFYLRTHGVIHSFVMVDGYRIHYLEAKPEHAGPERPLVLIHGLGARATDWAPLMPKLAAAGFHVYALDLLGYGSSPKPASGDFSLRGEEHIVAGFMQALHIPRADVAGWSMGGWVAMLTALNHPEVVHRLLLYDSAGLYFRIDFPLTLFTPTDRAGLEALTARIEPDRPRVHIPAFAVPGMLRRFRENQWIVSRSFDSMLAGRDILDFRVSRLKMPVLIVWGTEDKLTPFALAERLHLLVPQSVLFGFTGCGHLTAAECAAQVLPVTLKFLNANPPLPTMETILDGTPGALPSEQVAQRH